MSKTTLVKVPSLKVGDDKKVAAILTEQHDKSFDATKIIVDTGLLCYWVKENTDHGQFGPWLQAHCPERMWRNNSKGKPVASSTLSWQMNTTKRLLESCHITVEKLLSLIPKSMEFDRKGQFLQLSAGNTILANAPEQISAFHKKALQIVEGKTAYQLFLEFKQGEASDEDAPEETQQKKPGRLKGQGGNTREQRAAAKEAMEQAEIEETENKVETICDLINEVCGAKGLPRVGDKVFERFKKAVQFASGFVRENGRSSPSHQGASK